MTGGGQTSVVPLFADRRPSDHPTSGGTARAVSTNPTTTIASDETAGTTAARRPGAGRRVALTTSTPIVVSVAARPALKATISTSPSTISCWAIAPSSTTRAVGHGIIPALAPLARVVGGGRAGGRGRAPAAGG